MNLDLAIQNVLKRSEMENAMHGVMSNFGGSYQLTSYTESAKSAESILGTPVAHMTPNALSRPTLVQQAEVYEAKPPTENMSANIDGYDISWDAQTKNWTLSQTTKATGFFDKLFGREPQSKIMITKYGTNSTNRFLSAVENSSIVASTKNKIAAFVMTSMRSGSVETFQQGYAVDTKTDDNVVTSSSSARIMEAPNRAYHSQELNLASEYQGVAKQRNDTFMGDTVIPQPLSSAQVGMLRTPLGDPVGLHVSPPTRHMGNIKTNRSL
tara:strand:+ start:3366 stop:4169 length:804 start_codon:yes stop_codon:yes gene_type:complete